MIHAIDAVVVLEEPALGYACDDVDDDAPLTPPAEPQQQMPPPDPQTPPPTD